MKNIVIPIIIIATLLAVFSGCTTHREVCEITEVRNGIVTVVDHSGELWEFYSDANWFVGEWVEVTFDRKPNADNLHEVEIVNARLAY